MGQKKTKKKSTIEENIMLEKLVGDEYHAFYSIEEKENYSKRTKEKKTHQGTE